MSAQTITAALTTGVMKPIGDGLDRRELRDVVAYLAAPEGPAGTAWIDDNLCAADKRAVDLSAKPAQIGYGVDTDNSRRMTAAQAGLTGKQAASLEVAWSFAMPKTSGLRGQGVVVGSTLFYPAGQANYVLALDTKTGCVKWATPTASGIRNSLAYGRLGANGPMALVGGDGAGKLTAFDARTGKVIWAGRSAPRQDRAAERQPDLRRRQDRGADLGHRRGQRHAAQFRVLQGPWRGRPGRSRRRQAAVDLAHHGDRQAAGPQERAGGRLYGPSGAPIWSSPPRSI